MLMPLSKRTTCRAVAPRLDRWRALISRGARRQTGGPADTSKDAQSKSSSNCSMMSRRRLRFCDLIRNSMAAQREARLKGMRLIRWMAIGEPDESPADGHVARLEKYQHFSSCLPGRLVRGPVVQEPSSVRHPDCRWCGRGYNRFPGGHSPADFYEIFFEGFHITVAKALGIASVRACSSMPSSSVVPAKGTPARRCRAHGKRARRAGDAAAFPCL